VDTRHRADVDHRNQVYKVVGPPRPTSSWFGQPRPRDGASRVQRRLGAPTAINSPLADRGVYTKSAFSQRGQLYKRQLAVDAASSSPTYLESNYWTDAVGRGVASWEPNGPATKVKRDGHGRIVKAYLTDRGGDALPGTSGNYADATA